MNDNKERTSIIMTVRPNKDYLAVAPRIIQGKWLNGFIKRTEREKAEEAFGFFCEELKRGIKVELAKERTKQKFKIPVIVKKCKPKTDSQELPIFEVYVGNR